MALPVSIRLLAAPLAAVLLAGAWACGGRPVAERPQVFTLSGTVQDKEGRTLPHATVAFEGVPVGAMTDSLGRFRIEPIQEGEYRFVVLHLGYRSAPFFLALSEPVESSATLPLFRDPELGPALADSLGTVRIVYRIQGRP